MTYTTEGIKSKGGIIIGINRDEEYEDERTTHAADLAEIWARVYKLPEKLYFDKTDPRSMSWECDMDLEIGDLCGSILSSQPMLLRYYVKVRRLRSYLIVISTVQKNIDGLK